MSTNPAETAGHDSPELELLERLIRRPSVTPDDAGCQELMATELAALGFDCEHMPFGEVSNLWARRGTDGPLLCFAGHTDVVPPGDESGWDSDPFEPVIRDGLLYGRGAADMKASLAAMITALKRFIGQHPEHPGSIALLITSDEEGPADDGTKKVVEALAARGEKIDWCVLGEPSSHSTLGDTIRIGRRGSLSGILEVRGKQGHVAYPHLASNPIRTFAPVLSRLNDIRWDEGNAHFPPTSFEVVEIEAGVGAPNVIPGSLRARFNFRYSTQWSKETLKEEVHAVFGDFEIDFELNWRLSGEPFLTEPGKLTTAAARAIEEVAGIETELSTGGGTSDGRFISPAGADVVELGPVSTSIHQVNEHVAVADLPRLSKMYERILELMLLDEPGS
jgi:succinyl-diaminopimelate desuccinylase